MYFFSIKKMEEQQERSSPLVCSFVKSSENILKTSILRKLLKSFSVSSAVTEITTWIFMTNEISQCVHNVIFFFFGSRHSNRILPHEFSNVTF